MAKICIVTFFRGHNYGSKLQSYALSNYFSSLGYETYMYTGFKVPSYLMLHPSLLYARLYNLIYKKRFLRFFDPVPYTMSEKSLERDNEFNERFYNSICFRDRKSWKSAIRDRMIFVAGSDIIWQPNIGYPSKYFLDFAVIAGLPCFSYASSIGALELPKKYYRAYRKYLNSFISIGVREDAAVDLLKPLVNRSIVKVLDPTLLVDRSVWDDLSANCELTLDVRRNAYILCYFVMDDERYWNYVKLATSDLALPVVVIPMHNSDEKRSYTILEDGTPPEFVKLINNASIIITDSFHACVFSMIYRKDFYLIRRERIDEDSKFNDFLYRYKLQERVVNDTEHFVCKPNTNYDYAINQLETDKEESKRFVSMALAQSELLNSI